MKHFTIVGNWKMHQNPKQAVNLVKRLQKKAKPHTHVTGVVCPPFVDLAPIKEILEDDLLKLGAQDIDDHDEGTYTGQISGPILKGLAEYVIVGHSERRRNQHESDTLIGKKVSAAIRNGITPILCVGEKLSDRQEGLSERVVTDQLTVALSHISDSELKHVIIAYEPVWAISSGDGKGQFATPDKVAPIYQAIRQTVEGLFGEGASSQIKILYGGSVNPDNATSYLAMEHTDGLLVGGASLNYLSFAAIITAAQKQAQ